jgi:hypothetical protein
MAKQHGPVTIAGVARISAAQKARWDRYRAAKASLKGAVLTHDGSTLIIPPVQEPVSLPAITPEDKLLPPGEFRELVMLRLQQAVQRGNLSAVLPFAKMLVDLPENKPVVAEEKVSEDEFIEFVLDQLRFDPQGRICKAVRDYLSGMAWEEAHCG